MGEPFSWSLEEANIYQLALVMNWRLLWRAWSSSCLQLCWFHQIRPSSFYSYFFFSLKYSIPGKKKLSSKACASAVSLNKFCLDDPRDSWRFFSSGPWLQDCPFLVSSHRSCTHKDIPRVNRLLSLQLNNVTQNREMWAISHHLLLPKLEKMERKTGAEQVDERPVLAKCFCPVLHRTGCYLLVTITHTQGIKSGYQKLRV